MTDFCRFIGAGLLFGEFLGDFLSVVPTFRGASFFPELAEPLILSIFAREYPTALAIHSQENFLRMWMLNEWIISMITYLKLK